MRNHSVLFLVAALAACGGDGASDVDDPTGQVDGGPIEVAGAWGDDFGGWTVIDEGGWGDAVVVAFDNAANHAVTQMRGDDPWSPSKFARVEWTEPDEDGGFFHCTVAFGAGTSEDALQDPAEADATDPAAGGCGGFAWTRMSRAIEVHGFYEDQFGYAHRIGSTAWSGAEVVTWDDANNVAVTRNPDDAEYDPGKFGRVEWTEPDAEGVFHFCQVAFGKDSAEAAAEDPAVADAADPDAGGCGGFAWSRATPTLEVHGEWDDGFGTHWVIKDGKWGAWSVVEHTNEYNRAIVQYPADDEYNPSGFSKVVWTEPEADGSFFYCSVNFGKEDALSADVDATSWDSSDPAAGGCGGFAWTRMARSEAE